jgi:hypothetical protein
VATVGDVEFGITFREVRRAQAYTAIDSERDYQVERWKDSACRGTEHSVTEFLAFLEFLAFMRHHVNKALDTVSTEPEPDASRAALEVVRKIAALAVACMERHGAPRRQGY